ncbi:uncharacterized protein [Amphiura filiformis]|uniref:uncharacterized protein isoform X8 n=1 Tax=Amphiura filiformis TaxID=82378 RepID=UPI003B218C44
MTNLRFWNNCDQRRAKLYICNIKGPVKSSSTSTTIKHLQRSVYSKLIALKLSYFGIIVTRELPSYTYVISKANCTEATLFWNNRDQESANLYICNIKRTGNIVKHKYNHHTFAEGCLLKANTLKLHYFGIIVTREVPSYTFVISKGPVISSSTSTTYQTFAEVCLLKANTLKLHYFGIIVTREVPSYTFVISKGPVISSITNTTHQTYTQECLQCTQS